MPEEANKKKTQNAKQAPKPKQNVKKASNNNVTKASKHNAKQEDVASKLIISMGGGMVRLALDILLYLFLIFAAVYSCKYAYNFCYQVFGSASVTDEANAYSMSITIYDGESTLDIAKRLEGYELIPNKYSFVVKSRLDKVAIKPGTFILSSDMDYDEILDIISDVSQIQEEEKEVPVVPDKDDTSDEGESASDENTDSSSE